MDQRASRLGVRNPPAIIYYLIGARIGSGESIVQHSLWADSAEDERRIWRAFLAILTAVGNPVLVHYGRFETTFLKHMHDRYGGPPEDSAAAKALKTPVNLLTVIFAQVYFPTYTNGLKTALHNRRWIRPLPARSTLGQSGWG
ncbi:MAG: ribonuclease H-like domain-containing protein [Kiritimatiellaeota bacterium]|nr:ribonuclease H-like domain-containing protein [Kiritimatiellota bacterium]